MKKAKFGYIDIFKFLFSICIIALHTDLLINTNVNINWYVTHLIFRLAVPFFFITSGFFYGKKILEEKSNIKELTKIYIKRLSYPFIFFLIIGLPFVIFQCYDGNIFKTVLIIIQKILFYPWGALWYIGASIVAIFILSKFYQKKKFYFPILISFFLYLFALLCNSYYFTILDKPFLKDIIDLYMKFFLSARNGIFVGMLYISLGVILSKLYKENNLLSKKENIIGLLFIGIIYILEIYIIKNKITIDDNSLFISLPFLSFLLVSFLIQLNSNKEFKKLRNLSTGFYLVHRPILEVIKLFVPSLTGVACFILTLLLSLIICLIIYKSNNKFIRKIMLA